MRSVLQPGNLPAHGCTSTCTDAMSAASPKRPSTWKKLRELADIQIETDSTLAADPGLNLFGR